MGGYSSEHDISMKSGNVVHAHLNRDRYNTYRIHITKEKWVFLDENDGEHPITMSDFSLHIENTEIHFDCVFNAIHGTPGEDGLLQAYFELLGIPQTSCDHYQAALTFNKRDLLSALRPYGIQCATSYFLNLGDTIDENAIIGKVGLPCFVKANKAGSSYGITKVYQPEQLLAAIQKGFSEDNELIIESFLDGIEVSVGVITYQGKIKVLPPTEIVTDNDFFDYEAKYEGKSEEITPARISKVQEEKVCKIAKKTYEVLKLKGFTRSEYIFIEDEPYLLEINTTPGLTVESILPKQAKKAGLSLEQLFESAIVEVLNENYR